MRALGFLCLASVSLAAEEKAAVIVLGGGASGIGAAKTLYDAGVTDFLIIEGRSELGGRTKGRTFGGITLQEGAAWIQGLVDEEGHENPIWTYAKELNIQGNITNWTNVALYHKNGSQVDYAVFYKWHLRVHEAMEFCLAKYEQLWESAEQQDLDVYESIDISVEACFEEFGYLTNAPATEIEIAKTMMWDELEFEYALGSRNLSTMWSYPTNEYLASDFFITDSRGYEHILQNVVDTDFSSKVRLNQKITNVAYDATGVTVTTAGGDTFHGDYAISTFSLGVMQRGLITWEPAFSADKQAGINGMHMANYEKVTLKFAEKFWGDEQLYYFVDDEAGWGTIGLNMDVEGVLPGSKMLEFHFEDEHARLLQSQQQSATVDSIMEVLRSVFGANVPEPTEVDLTTWMDDEWTYGSYASWPLGYTEDEWLAMKEPVGRLHFAGEHLWENFGYVHSGWASGIAVAQAVFELGGDNLTQSTGNPAVVDSSVHAVPLASLLAIAFASVFA